jgi:hypothetical protein
MLGHVTEPAKPPSEVLHIRLWPGSIARIDAEAVLDHRNRSDMVRKLLTEALDAREAQRKGGRR